MDIIGFVKLGSGREVVDAIMRRWAQDEANSEDKGHIRA
jgi:hypothetical protein